MLLRQNSSTILSKVDWKPLQPEKQLTLAGWIQTINRYNLETAVMIDTIPTIKKEHEVSVGISNSFRFGGHNLVVVFAPLKP